MNVENPGKLYKKYQEVLLVLALILDYTSFNLLFYAWNPRLIYFTVSVLVTSLVAGSIFRNTTKSTLYPLLSMIMSVVLATVLVTSPTLICGQFSQIDYAISLSLAFFLQIWIFGGAAVACLLGGMIGGILTEDL